MKKVLIITSSYRKDSNSSLLAQAFKEGASKDNEVEMISLEEHRIAPCIVCNQYQKIGQCFMNDLNDIMNKVIKCDVLVFASPTYYYSVCGTLKNFIDRTYSQFNKIKNKDFYYIGSSIDLSHKSIDGALQSFYGLIRCVENVELKGVIFGTELNNEGEARNSIHYKEAYGIGRSI